METAIKASNRIPEWVQRLVGLRWYQWLGWFVELGLIATFVVVTQTQFAEEEPRAGWIMSVLTVLFCGPGIWLLLGYKHVPGKFSKYDIGAIVCFAIWAIVMLYLVVPLPAFEPGPFGAHS